MLTAAAAATYLAICNRAAPMYSSKGWCSHGKKVRP